MLERILGAKAFLTAQAALDGTAARHAAIANNIANVNTPGFKRSDVPFEQCLSKVVRDRLDREPGDVSRIAEPFTPPVVRDAATSNRLDGNNVDLEREMAMMAENTLRYETLGLYVSRFFNGLKTVINSR
jgi:flagellar basal-body rod protein FlgB